LALPRPWRRDLLANRDPHRRNASDGSVLAQPSTAFNDEAKRLEFVRRLNAAGLGLSEGNTTGKPTVPLSALSDPTALQHFLAALDWLVQAVNER
jgi:hypothetical protein